MEKKLSISAVIGFKGSVVNGLILHPDNENVIFPLGSTIIVRHIVTRTQTFLQGHDNEITCLTVSKSGKYLASGQKTYSGFQADILIWDFASKTQLFKLRMHKVMVATLSFSANEDYLASVGGIDDKNMLIIWSLEANGDPVYGCNTGQDPVNQISFFNQDNNKLCLVTDANVQILEIDKANKKINSVKCNLGSIKRSFTCLALQSNDEHIFAGTKTGDIMEIHVKSTNFKRIGPSKCLFAQGVKVVTCLPNDDLIIGAGDGTLAKLSINSMNIKCATQVLGGVTSITFTSDATHFFCGTSQCNIYWVDSSTLVPELRNTCHYDKINDIVFPHNYSNVFATCSKNDIRIWNASNIHEILRLQVPNVEANCVCFTRDGKSILSGWDDGKIRAFYPQSGKLMFVINDAHIHGVTAICSTSDCQNIVSGGVEGEVRVWKITRQHQTMLASMKEHTNRVWSIQLRENNEQAVSCSSDRTCIIWDMKTYTRVLCFMESTLFKQVLWHPDESQILTTGSNRKIFYWGTFDGQMIRMVDGSETGEINTLSITAKGDYFLSGGEDKIVKLWRYDDGQCYYHGEGHAGTINRIMISPDQKTIVSVGSEGAIIVWKTPEECLE